MALFNKNKNNGGILDVIRCDEPSYLIWKWHPKGTETGESTRETAIRWGSSLRVKDGEVAIFVYKQKDGKMQDFIVGLFDQTIKTANFPILSSIIGLVYDGDTPFQAEIYFINMKIQLIDFLLIINIKQKSMRINISYHILILIESNPRFLIVCLKLFLTTKTSLNILLYME